jgi:hypothetical protein
MCGCAKEGECVGARRRENVWVREGGRMCGCAKEGECMEYKDRHRYGKHSETRTSATQRKQGPSLVRTLRMLWVRVYQYNLNTLERAKSALRRKGRPLNLFTRCARESLTDVAQRKETSSQG